jgi:primosomal protein N' (replication factor Y)
MSLEERRLSFKSTQTLYADVIVPRHIAKAFTYVVPASLGQTLAVGRLVLVPFGQTMLEGVVISLSHRPPVGMKAGHLKEICSLAEGARDAELSPAQLDLCRAIAEHYVAPWGQCLRLVLPRNAGARAVKPDALRRSVKPTDIEEDRGEPSGRYLLAEQLPEQDPIWIARVSDCFRADRAKKLVLRAPWEHRVSRLVGAIQQARAAGKTAIILSGEIARVEWLSCLLSGLTKLPVTVIAASPESKHWIQTQDGAPSVVVGTRAAVFSPLRSIGLIWVDGEEDPAFKEPQEPRYHAREVAWMRAEREGALLVLASAHPSLESLFDPAVETYAVPPEPARRPAVELVDLRSEPGGTLFSRKLVEAMREAVENEAGILLFLNRKGYARTLMCRDCGWMPRCPTCAVVLAYSREASSLICRYCGGRDSLPHSCPLCGASHLNPVGDGTERVEAEARRLFPQAKIARLDGDRLRRAAAVRDLWNGVRSGRWEILIGTQALFQREPLPHRGLVGILQADSGLHVPDFRAAERTYQLLDEAISFARPASEGGRVILQTRLPAHHVVQAALSADPHRFYEEELAARRLLNYPPACNLAALSVSGKDPREVEMAAKQWRSRLEETMGGEATMTVLGPVPATGRRPKGHHRHQILAKGTDRALLCRRIEESVVGMEREYRKGRIKFVVDVDPIEMG